LHEHLRSRRNGLRTSRIAVEKSEG
jgi:hypothetical protein